MKTNELLEVILASKVRDCMYILYSDPLASQISLRITGWKDIQLSWRHAAVHNTKLQCLVTINTDPTKAIALLNTRKGNEMDYYFYYVELAARYHALEMFPQRDANVRMALYGIVSMDELYP